MLSMIIVDDEDIIREGLRDYIAWSEMGIQISGEAENGKEALQRSGISSRIFCLPMW